jgi:hypothetical protein
MPYSKEKKMAAKEVSSPKSGTVFVGCKLPHGLVLQLTKPMELKENVLGGGVNKFVINKRTAERYKLNGVALEPGDRPRFVLTNGAAITKIPADFWAKWLEQNSECDAVKNGLVFSSSSEADTRAIARERKKEKSGFEPIDISVDSKGKAVDPRARGVKPVNKKDVEDDDEESMEEA